MLLGFKERGRRSEFCLSVSASEIKGKKEEEEKKEEVEEEGEKEKEEKMALICTPPVRGLTHLLRGQRH